MRSPLLARHTPHHVGASSLYTVQVIYYVYTKVKLTIENIKLSKHPYIISFCTKNTFPAVTELTADRNTTKRTG